MISEICTSHSTVPPIVTNNPYEEIQLTTQSNIFPTSNSFNTDSLSSFKASLSDNIILFSSSSILIILTLSSCPIRSNNFSKIASWSPSSTLG